MDRVMMFLGDLRPEFAMCHDSKEFAQKGKDPGARAPPPARSLTMPPPNPYPTLHVGVSTFDLKNYALCWIMYAFRECPDLV